MGAGGAIVAVASTTGLVNGLPNAGNSDVFVTRFVSDCAGLSVGADFRCPPGTPHHGDNIGANCTFQKWTPLRMLPESGSIP